MTVDPRTLLFSLVLTNALMAISMIVAARGRNPGGKRDGSAKWALALVLETLAWSLVTARGDIPDFHSIVLGNFFKASAHAFVLAAVYEFQQRACPRWQYLAPVGLATLTAFLLLDNFQGRLIGSSLISAFQMVLIARALLAYPESRAGKAWKLLFAGVLLFFLFLMLRATMAVLSYEQFAQPISASTPHPVQLIGYAAMVATTLLGSMGFILMVKERSDREIMHLAMTDSLTQVFNRHAFMQYAELTLARRGGQPLAFLMLDVDHFKRINDTYGHPAGDEVLRQVAGLLTSRLRRQDILGRYGGEEFCVVAPDTGPPGALILAESLREIMAAAPLRTERGALSITVSIGISLCPQGSDRPLKDILAEADQALYRAKQSGRNRVVAFS